MFAYTIHACYAFRVPILCNIKQAAAEYVMCYMSKPFMHQLYSFTYKTVLNRIDHVQQNDNLTKRQLEVTQHVITLRTFCAFRVTFCVVE